MLRISTFLIFLNLFSSPFWGQNSSELNFIKVDPLISSTPQKVKTQNYSGFELIDFNKNWTTEKDLTTLPAELVGTSVYDLQSNASCRRQIKDFGGNGISATWTMGFDASNDFPNLGSGYNTNDGSGWGPPPMNRVESIKTAMPSIGELEDGTPVILAHTFENKLRLSRFNPVTGWVETDIPSSVSTGLLWSQMAVGGEDGNTIHAIALTTPIENGGESYNGVNGHLLYFRSINGGQTWDKLDVIIPGLDNSKYSFIGADNYSIDADNDNVAIGLWGKLGDVTVAKSTNNGETWDLNILRDFPIDGYAIDDGWNEENLSFQDTTGAPIGFPTAIRTSDGTGSVIIDDEGMVHAWYGEMFYIDQDLGDGEYSFFPLWSGIRYWNESYGTDNTVFISGLVDENGDDQFNLQSNENGVAGNYQGSLTSMMSSAIDVNGNLYLVYGGLSEQYWKEDANPELQHYHNVYVIVSQNGGETWSEPFNIINEGFVDDDDLIPAMEAVYPSVNRNINSNGILDITYQLDFEPGSVVGNDSDFPDPNFFYHLSLDVEDIGITIVSCDAEPPIVESNSPIWVGETLQLSEISQNAESWEWTGPDNFSSTSQGLAINGVTSADAGIYTVMITDAEGCTASIDIIVTIFEETFPSTLPPDMKDSLMFFGYPYDVDSIGAPFASYELVVEFDSTATDMERQELRDTFGVVNLETCVCNKLELWTVGDHMLVGNDTVFNIGINEKKLKLSARSKIDGVDFNYYNVVLMQNNFPTNIPHLDTIPSEISNPTNDEVLIAVLDTGVDYTHNDLKDYIWKKTSEAPSGADDDMNCHDDDFLGWNFHDDNNNPSDNHSHGTHVAGIIKDNIFNNDPPCQFKILPVKTHGPFGFSTLWNILCGMYYAMEEGSDIINASWGFPAQDVVVTLENAVEEALFNNTLIVAAAGNDTFNLASTPYYPACIQADNLISVVSVNEFEPGNIVLSGFSNYSVNCTEIAAPGENIVSTVPGNGLQQKSGTSMAAPVVSAAAAIAYCGGKEHLGAKNNILFCATEITQLNPYVVSGNFINLDPNCLTPIFEVPNAVIKPFAVFPNPASQEITISFFDQNPRDDWQVSLYDLIGHQVKLFEINQFSSDNEFKINLDGILPGAYVLSIKQSDYIWSEKLIIY